MNLDLYITFKNTEFIFLDNSVPIVTLPEVTQWSIKLYSKEDDKSFTVNILEYLENRESYEIAKIYASDFGLNTFKDGIYKFTYSVNNEIQEGTFIVYTRIKEALDSYIKDTNYTVTVGEYDLEYTGIEIDTKGDLERINLANSLFIELQQDIEEERQQAIIEDLIAILEIDNT